MNDKYKKPKSTYRYRDEPQPPTPRKKKAVKPPVKKVVEPPKATRNCRVGDKQLVKGLPVTGVSAKVLKNLKKRGLVK